MIWFSSDPHYFHNNIIKYSERPFKDVSEMNEALINNWNACITPHDEAYLLGDIGFAPEDKLYSVLSRLNGKKHLILGNHDKVIRKSHRLKNLFLTVSEYKEIYLNNGELAVLCHYPIMSWNRQHRGSYMLHGHSHGKCKYPFNAKIMDVGVDPQGYLPISEKQIINKLGNIKSESLDYHSNKGDNE